MQKIASFTVNHDTLEKGMYISRIDGDVVTYDVRMKKPNGGDYLSPSVAHTIEHLFATYARNSKWQQHVLYVGPMGHGTELPEDMTIPMIILGAEADRVAELENVNIKDIAPTITALLGVEPDAEWEGKSMVR